LVKRSNDSDFLQSRWKLNFQPKSGNPQLLSVTVSDTLFLMNQTIEGFGYPETLIKEYDHWVVLLRPKQVTVGSLIIAAKTDVTKLGDLSVEAWSEFAQISKELEQRLTERFGADKFNYLALMMVDPNPHFHFIPRYFKPVEINGKKFPDKDWPKKTELSDIEMDDETLNEIKSRLEM
jgi:diadenosine tetraphosphate (Ap4A) HIT family hydrolase